MKPFVVKAYDKKDTFVLFIDKEGEPVKGFCFHKSMIPEILEIVGGQTFKEMFDEFPTEFEDEVKEILERGLRYFRKDNPYRGRGFRIVPNTHDRWKGVYLDPETKDRFLLVSRKNFLKYYLESKRDHLSEYGVEQLNNLIFSVWEKGLRGWWELTSWARGRTPRKLVELSGTPIKPGRLLRLYLNSDALEQKKEVDLLGEQVAVALRMNTSESPEILVSEKPSKIYTLYGIEHTCMKNKDEATFFIYNDIKNCKIAYILEGTELQARALLWENVEVKDKKMTIKIMDRIYYNSDKLRDEMIRWAWEHGYWTKSQQSLNWFQFVNPETEEVKQLSFLRVDAGFDFEEGQYDLVPYIDTFCKLSIGDHYLQTYWGNEKQGQMIKLQNQEGAGGPLTRSYLCCKCENVFPEGDIREFEGEFYCEDCFHENIGTCEDCDSNEYYDNMLWAYWDGHEGYRCSDCAQDYTQSTRYPENYWSDDRCIEAYNSTGRQITLTPDDLEDYSECSICGEFHHRDNIRMDRYGNEYCSECYENDVKPEDKE